MLTLDLVRLHRENSLVVDRSVPADAHLWSGSELNFVEPVHLRGTATPTPEGGVLVRGKWKTSVKYVCGRCVEPVIRPIERELTLVFMPSEGWEAADPEIRIIGFGARTLDLADAIREEVLLEVPRYLVPPAGKDGRCSMCNVAVHEFDRAPEEEASDPRWSKLKALENK